MTIFIITLLFLLCVVAAMAVGVIFSNKPIKGSCGGIQALGLGGKCDICGGDTEVCEEENKKQALATTGASVSESQQANFYNADK